MRVTVTTDGLRRLAREHPARADAVLGKLARDFAADMTDSFSAESPSAPGSPPGVDTGNLKNSILARPTGTLEWTVSVGAPYGVPLEYGTRRMAARPFFRPAFLRTVRRAPDELIEVITP